MAEKLLKAKRQKVAVKKEAANGDVNGVDGRAYPPRAQPEFAKQGGVFRRNRQKTIPRQKTKSHF